MDIEDQQAKASQDAVMGPKYETISDKSQIAKPSYFTQEELDEFISYLEKKNDFMEEATRELNK